MLPLFKRRNPLAFKVLVLVLFFSSCLTLAATGLQLHFNFKKDFSGIETEVEQIRKGYEQGLSLGLWDLDTNQINSLLGGIIQLPHIQYLEIRDNAGVTVAALGDPRPRGRLERSYPLFYSDSRGKTHELGDFTIMASLDGIYRRLRESVLQILISQTIKTFLVSGFILLVIRHLITRHLAHIAGHMGRGNLGYLDDPIRLSRPTPVPRDELDQVVEALNQGRSELLQYIDERNQKEAQLTQARQDIADIVDALPSALVGIDHKGRITQWNTGAEALTDLPRPRALGQDARPILSPLAPDMDRILDRHTQGQTLNRVPLPVKDGLRFYDINRFPLAASGGMVIRMDDVTQRVKMEEMMLVNEKVHSVGMLAAGVAHEINNPINAVINLADILKMDCPDQSPEHDLACRIHREGERVAAIVNSLLSFARSPGHSPQITDLSRILTETLALTRTQLKKDHIVLTLELPQRELPLQALPQQIQQVFLNLINNARFALNSRHPGSHPNKTLAIALSLEKTESGPRLRAEFLDQGTGISSKDLPHVTAPFYTTKPAGVGTGLGLSLSRTIVENHGGTLLLNSRQGEFTRVTLDLPGLDTKDISS